MRALGVSATTSRVGSGLSAIVRESRGDAVRDSTSRSRFPRLNRPVALLQFVASSHEKECGL